MKAVAIADVGRAGRNDLAGSQGREIAPAHSCKAENAEAKSHGCFLPSKLAASGSDYTTGLRPFGTLLRSPVWASSSIAQKTVKNRHGVKEILDSALLHSGTRTYGMNLNRQAGHNGHPYGVKSEESEYHPDIFVCGGPRLSWPEFWKEYQAFG